MAMSRGAHAGLEFRLQGDAGLLVYLGHEMDPALNARVRALAAALAARPQAGVREVAPAYACLLLHLDPVRADVTELKEWVAEELARLPRDIPAQSRLVEAPVVYGGDYGPDLGDVAAHLGMSAQEIIHRHASRDYPCYLVGFTPGFPYLGGLDPALACPRLDSPRLDLPTGVVGIAGHQTGLYPLGGPGGWRILGRTPLLVYDPNREPPTLIQAGDMVRFTPVDGADFPDPPANPAPAQGLGRPVLKVLHPGALTTVQDLGRWGYQDRGVPPAGALDQASLALANMLVGNPPHTAALEMTLLAPRLKAVNRVTLAVAGADLSLTVDGRPLPPATAVTLEPGQVLAGKGPRGGARAVLALAGGVAGHPLLGSLSAYPLGRLGGPLQAGQILEAAAGPEAGPEQALPPALAARLMPLPQDGEITLRALPGPNSEFFSAAGREAFFNEAFTITEEADRRGVRLTGPKVELDPDMPDSILSEPNSPGVVQVPPGGQPIILLREQTVGGYAKIATILTPDLDLLARALPGTRLRFRAVDEAEALAAARRARDEVAAAGEAMRS